MTDSNDERRLRGLLDDAVSDIEPRNALDQIRARTKENQMTDRRPWIWGVGGAVVATAATVALIAAVGTPGGDEADKEDPVAPTGSVSENVDPTTDVTPTEPDGPDPSESGEPATGEKQAVGVYYLGDTPSGAGLYREFHQVPEESALLGALREATVVEPADPDYRTPWLGVMTIDSAEVDGDVLRIGLSDVAERPARMTDREAELAIQQLIYTAQAAVQQRLPVQFEVSGNPVAETLGVPTSEPLTQAAELDVLALVSLTTPAEGQTVSGGRLEFSGRASSFEATVPWQLRQGDEVIRRGSVMSSGDWMTRLAAFEGAVSVAGLTPGTYTFAAMTDDPSGGAEGNGPSEDTRTIVVK
ncbi:Gmad2 immunoglobulin-like domain-containing protein [Nocardioides speluncae]|uniref:Gmad2 immunoglobulin-like domain-containing protein n=1 Tax=Nocardioides speluncae TaxID=2670337 RepID=UPI000D69470D|nr:Gmad2 immunoglobulin-like domain-containing protein [Nocardioides speluncae]